MDKKRIYLLVVFLTLMTASFFGMTLYSSISVVSELKTLAAESSCNGPFLARGLSHTKGLFSSSGQIELDFPPSCSVEGQTEQNFDRLSMKLLYQVEHWPTLSSFSRFKWSATPTKNSMGAPRQALKTSLILTGEGYFPFFGTASSSISIGDLAYDDGLERFQIQGVNGDLEIDHGVLGLNLSIDKVLYLGANDTFELKSSKVRGDLEPSSGKISFKLGALDTKSFTIHDLKVDADVNKTQDSFGSSIALDLQNWVCFGLAIKELEMDFSLDGLNRKGIETVLGIISYVSQGQVDDQKIAQNACNASKQLLFSGFKSQLSKLKGKRGGGTFDATASFVVSTKTDLASFVFSRQVQSSGRITLNNVLSPEEKSALFLSANFTQTANGLESSFEYADTIFKENGLIVEKPALKDAITQLDSNLINWFHDCDTNTQPPSSQNGSDLNGQKKNMAQANDPSSLSDAEKLAIYNAEQRYAAAQDDLNLIWMQATNDFKNKMAEAQTEWFKKSVSECSDRAYSISPDRLSNLETIKNDCMAEMTNARAKLLKSLIAKDTSWLN